jgi:hypothetical protein
MVCLSSRQRLLNVENRFHLNMVRLLWKCVKQGRIPIALSLFWCGSKNTPKNQQIQLLRLEPLQESVLMILKVLLNSKSLWMKFQLSLILQVKTLLQTGTSLMDFSQRRSSGLIQMDFKWLRDKLILDMNTSITVPNILLLTIIQLHQLLPSEISVSQSLTLKSKSLSWLIKLMEHHLVLEVEKTSKSCKWEDWRDLILMVFKNH